MKTRCSLQTFFCRSDSQMIGKPLHAFSTNIYLLGSSEFLLCQYLYFKFSLRYLCPTGNVLDFYATIAYEAIYLSVQIAQAYIICFTVVVVDVIRQISITCISSYG